MAVNGARMAALQAMAEKHAAAIQLIEAIQKNMAGQIDMAEEQEWNPERVRSEADAALKLIEALEQNMIGQRDMAEEQGLMAEEQGLNSKRVMARDG